MAIIEYVSVEDNCLVALDKLEYGDLAIIERSSNSFVVGECVIINPDNYFTYLNTGDQEGADFAKEHEVLFRRIPEGSQFILTQE